MAREHEGSLPVSVLMHRKWLEIPAKLASDKGDQSNLSRESVSSCALLQF